jgi:hypothetical protein
LTFSRDKFVGIECPAKEVFLAHGVLDDRIYGLGLDVEVKTPSFEITRIEGRWKRYTTPECPKAIPTLQRAVGWSIFEEEFVRKVNRIIWREGCEHFANLLLECCDAIKWAALYMEWQELKRKGATPDKKAFLEEKFKAIPDLRNSCMIYSGKEKGG